MVPVNRPRRPASKRPLASPQGPPSRKRLLVSLGGAFLFAGLVFLGSRVRIPLPGSTVPVTLQTFFVLLAGMLLGASSGAASQIVYLAAGTAGLPVFAGGSGPSALLGPTGGYLVGFVPAAWVSGRLVRARLGRSWVGAFLTALLATGVVLLLGGIHRTLFHDAGLAASLLPGGPILLAANVAKAAAAAAVWRGSRRFAPPGSP